MSGGHFDYNQYNIKTIADSLESIIDKNGKEIPRKENWYDEEWLKKYPEDRFYHNYSNEVIKEFKKGLIILKKAYIYAQRIDWLLSGDDGQENFLIRLKEELKNELHRTL